MNNDTTPNSETPIENFKEKYQYAVAEIQNQAKRFQKEKEEIVKFSNEKLIKEILTQLDGFDEALKFIQDPSSRQGIEYIKNNLIKALEKFGLSKIIAQPGEEFNPHFHEAIDTVVTSDFPENTISEQVQAGYQLSNKVLRAAKVTVNKAPLI